MAGLDRLPSRNPAGNCRFLVAAARRSDALRRAAYPERSRLFGAIIHRLVCHQRSFTVLRMASPLFATSRDSPSAFARPDWRFPEPDYVFRMVGLVVCRETRAGVAWRGDDVRFSLGQSCLWKPRLSQQLECGERRIHFQYRRPGNPSTCPIARPSNRDGTNDCAGSRRRTTVGGGAEGIPRLGERNPRPASRRLAQARGRRMAVGGYHCLRLRFREG